MLNYLKRDRSRNLPKIDINTWFSFLNVNIFGLQIRIPCNYIPTETFTKRDIFARVLMIH